MKRRLAAILCTDVAGYSRLVGADEEDIRRVFRAHFDALNATIDAHGGRVAPSVGDMLIAEFASVVTALRCAVSAQRDMADRNRDLPSDRRLEFRIGVSLGDVVTDREEIYGDGVNIAARLEGLAEAGGICISGRVFEQLGNNVDVGFVFLGAKQLKSIEKPFDAYKVLLDREHAGKVIGRPKAPTSPRWHWVMAAAVLALVVVVSGVGTIWSKPDVEDRAYHRPDMPSIAVLPFDSLSDDAEQDHFAAGLTNDLITELSKISGLFVISRHSVFTLEDTVKIQDVAAQLGVQYVLDGTLRRVGQRLRINAQLIEASTGMYIWTESYDREYSDWFELEDDVIDKIVSAMAVQLTTFEKEQLARIPTDSLEAYDYYLRAEQEGFYFSDVETYRRSLSFYQRAIELDPNFADAHAGMARIAVDVWRNNYNFLLRAAIARKFAYDAADRALDLDPNNARAYGVRALLQLVDGRLAEATESARRAVALKPNDAEAHGNLGLVLVRSGNLAEGVAEVEKALRLDPAPPPSFQLLAGVVFYTAHHYDLAIARLEVARDALPRTEPAREYLAAAYAYYGRQDLARQEALSLRRLFPETNLTYYQYLYDYWREEERHHHIKGLRRAGITEWPFGFEGRDEDRLNAESLKNLTASRTWVGRHNNGAPFMQQFDSAGNVAYRSANTFITGTVRIRQSMLCQRFEGFLDRAMCGYVYRNSSRTDEEEEEEDYVHVSPVALKYFSLED